jgi:hypothetical protein
MARQSMPPQHSIVNEITPSRRFAPSLAKTVPKELWDRADLAPRFGIAPQPVCKPRDSVEIGSDRAN